MGTLRLFKTTRLGVLARLASFFRPFPASRVPAAAPDYDYDKFVDITDEIIALQEGFRHLRPDPAPEPAEETLAAPVARSSLPYPDLGPDHPANEPGLADEIRAARARPVSSLRYPDLGADHIANEPGISASVAAARSALRRNPDAKKNLEEFLRRPPLPENFGKDFLKNRPVILDVRDGVFIYDDGTKIDSNRVLKSLREETNSDR
ncbi:MAG: hypothetical protein MPK08_00065 [Alphaproteobacteria bacterium]|nr:hypothetical protein [Alphaproteobacteria bacterium]MDA8003293.1 hypothetical protein [Alphaproteobacteria bacterium]